MAVIILKEMENLLLFQNVYQQGVMNLLLMMSMEMVSVVVTEVVHMK